MKEKKKIGLGYKILLIILCCIFAYSAFQVYTILHNYHVGTKTYNQVQKIAGTENQLGNINFNALAKENSDIKGWIFSKNTLINYPIVQGSDNVFYLTHMFNKEWNPKGSIFIDANNPDPFHDFNTIIYGHRMKDKSMFNSLGEYLDEDFYKKNKKMIIVTPEKKYNLEIFSAMTISADSDLYKISFNSDKEKQDYVDYVKANSKVSMDANASSSDKIVMLSTCTNHDQNKRIVVYGKLTDFNK